MSEVDSVILNLPDVWFDWYARLLPGCFGAGLYLYLSSSVPAAPTGVHIILFLLIGYGFGHVLHPASSFVVSLLEKFVDKLCPNENAYAEAKRDPQTRPSLQAHAEATSMFAFGLALLLNVVYFRIPRMSKKCAVLVLLLYFVLATVERTWSRNRKIEDLKSDAATAA